VLGSFDKVKETSLRKPELITEGRLHRRVPSFKDWRKYDTPVKDQVNCKTNPRITFIKYFIISLRTSVAHVGLLQL
jgi:hypothetical protein